VRKRTTTSRAWGLRRHCGSYRDSLCGYWASPRALRAAVVAAALLTGGFAADAQAQKNQPAQNQGPPNALQGFSQNRDEPVKIQADSLVVRDKDKIATFTGNVHVTQGDTEMRSKSLVVYYEEGAKDGAGAKDGSKPGSAATPGLKAAQPGPGGQQQIRRIEAIGQVLVTDKDQNAAGDTGVFDMPTNTVTLTGNPVVITRGKDVMRGQRLVVDLTTGVSKLESGGGQVEGLFQSTPHGDNSFPGAAPRPSHAN
jgi:lipopolysaccharide export system protein LptA